MSSTPSSRHKGHSSRKSQSSTPIPQSQSTPRGSRQQLQTGAASSSPMFFGSSPAQSAQQGTSQRLQNDFIISSPPRQASSAGDQDQTPRATRQAPPGQKKYLSFEALAYKYRIFPCEIWSKLQSSP